MVVVLDLETRPRPVTPDEAIEIATSSKKNPKKLPTTRAAWAAVLENQETACAAMALDASQCRIVVFSMIVDGMAPITFGHWDDEASILMAMWNSLDALAVERPGEWLWVGHNITAFDLVILRRACMRHGYRPECRKLWRSLPDYRYSKQIHDNAVKAVEPGHGYVSAHVLAQSIGVQDKGDWAVVDFPTMWARGADCIPELMARCEADVISEAAVYERFAAMWAD